MQGAVKNNGGSVLRSGQLWSRTKHTNRQALAVELSNARTLLSAIIVFITLGACASNPPINSFCAWYIPNDLSDPGLFKLNPTNKQAVIVNADTYDRNKCEAQKLGDRSNSGGPR